MTDGSADVSNVGEEAWSVRPGRGRRKALFRGSRLLGMMVDAFAGFATLDGVLDSDEAALILDLLRNAFPEADHSWLSRRVQRAVRAGRPLSTVAFELRDRLTGAQKLAVGLQLYTLVDAVGRGDRSRSAFEVFMRRLGRPEYARQIFDEMSGEAESRPAGFERVIFGHGPQADVQLPTQAWGHGFRVYRVADLLLVRNTGEETLWVRGRPLSPRAFLRMPRRQQLVVPGWTLNTEDLVFFLNVALTGNPSTIYLATTNEGWVSERTRSRDSMLRVRFGLEAEVQALQPTDIIIPGRGILQSGRALICAHTDRLSGGRGISIALDELRRRAVRAGGRVRLGANQRDFNISNDPSTLERGDLLLSPGLSPKVLLKVRIDLDHGRGEVLVREAAGTVLVDGVPVRASAELSDNSVIRLSSAQALRCRFSEGILDEERNLVELLRVTDLIHEFGRGHRALDNLSFTIGRGEMMCIMGPSGCGKSTLLNVLAGHLKPTRGKVRLNDNNLYKVRQALLPFITYMPQEEALNPQITVREHLHFAATIHRPKLPHAEIERRANGILAELGLQPIARRMAGSPGEKTLSGGERSRLNLGLDLSSPAELFLFDEPISGLSSKDSEHVTQTLRSLARDKIVIASMHRPGAVVMKLFDKILLLDGGGRLAYFGTPAGIIDYFREACQELKIPHPLLDSRTPLGADFVFDVLETPQAEIGGGQNPIAARRFPPSFWQERFESKSLVRSLGMAEVGPPKLEELPDLAVSPGRGFRRFRHFGSRLEASWRAFRTHFLRTLLSKLRNRGTIYATLIEAPLLALLIGVTLRSSPEGAYHFATALHIPAYYFLSATVAMFLGLTNSATEILRDRPVLRRERNTRQSMVLYVFAKFASLSLITATQCLIYAMVGHALLNIRGMLFDQWMWMNLTACTGTALALLVSASARTERGALTAVPLLLVPQMLLAGALIPFHEMNRGLFEDAKIERERGGIPVPSHLIPLRYAYEGMIVTQATRNPFDLQRIRIQRRLDGMRELPQPWSVPITERVDILKSALTVLVASTSATAADGAAKAAELAKLARDGTHLQLDAFSTTVADPEGRSLPDFFVNRRVELMLEEANNYLADYRNEELRRRPDIFLADRKPWFGGMFSTVQFSAIVLLFTIHACCGLATLVLVVQNRRTR